MLGLDGTNRTAGIGGLTLGRKGLSAQQPRETARLRELIARAGDTIAGNGRIPAVCCSFRAQTRLHLRIWLRRLHRVRSKRPAAPFAAGAGRNRTAVVLFISGPELTPVPMVDQIIRQLQLTPAEARLAA